MKRLIFSVLACLVLATPIATHAQSMHTLQALADAAPNSEVFAGKALWISYNFVGWPEYPQHASAVRINKCWAITAGHVVLDNSGFATENYKVGTGSNWMSDIGITRKVVKSYTHPTWDGSWDGQKIDLAVIRFDKPLPGTDLEIGALSLNDLFEYTGYARPATPALGLLPYDGQRRMFHVKATAWGSISGAISSNYVGSLFDQGPVFLAMGGVGTAGGSGSGGMNAAGKLVALLVAGVNSPNYGSLSYGVRLDLYKDWIKSYTNKSNACVPHTLTQSVLPWSTSATQVTSVALD